MSQIILVFRALYTNQDRAQDAYNFLQSRLDQVPAKFRMKDIDGGAKAGHGIVQLLEEGINYILHCPLEPNNANQAQQLANSYVNYCQTMDILIRPEQAWVIKITNNAEQGDYNVYEEVIAQWP